MSNQCFVQISLWSSGNCSKLDMGRPKGLRTCVRTKGGGGSSLFTSPQLCVAILAIVWALPAQSGPADLSVIQSSDSVEESPPLKKAAKKHDSSTSVKCVTYKDVGIEFCGN